MSEEASKKQRKTDVLWRYVRTKNRNPLALAEELARTEYDDDWRSEWKVFLIIMTVTYSIFLFGFIFFWPLLEALYAANGEMFLFFVGAVALHTFLSFVVLEKSAGGLVLPPTLPATPSQLRRLDVAYLIIGVARKFSRTILLVLLVLCLVFFADFDPFAGFIVFGTGLVFGMFLLFAPFTVFYERVHFCQSCQKPRKFYWRPGGRRCGACGWQIPPDAVAPPSP